MEPLLPDFEQAELAQLSQNITMEIGRLQGLVHSPIVRERIAVLVRQMNCYYSNLIEGHKTLPYDIERAHQDATNRGDDQKKNRLLAQAHIATEEVMMARLREGGVDVYAPEFVCWIHGEFYRRLPQTMWASKTPSGLEYRIEPGKLRDYVVRVGAHMPPDPDALPAFLARFHQVYGDTRSILATNHLIAIAAAHHRLAWIHPFGDGNGRVTRLHSHALLAHHGLDGDGLWTLSRGLARSRATYYARLHDADQPRQSDVDGRGNLTAGGLSLFCRFFLETILDQVTFMGGLLNLPDLRTRVERYFQFEALHLTRHREEIMRVVKALVDEGEFSRERVYEITGKGATTAAAIIKRGLAEGYFDSPSEKGKLRIAFPGKVLPFYFPSLFVDLPVDEETSRTAVSRSS